MYPAYQSMNSSYPPYQIQSAPHHQHHPGYHYQSWPPHSAYGYIVPQPPYTPTPPVYYPGGYHVHPASYPVCNNCPHTYAMAGEPQYIRPLGNFSGYHGNCCGCPNHQYKGDGNVKIEEESPDETVTKSSPVAWVSPGFMMSTASSDSGKPSRKDLKHSGGAEANERSKPPSEQNALLNRWIPLITYNTEGEDSARKQDNQGDDKKHFMNGWLPLTMDNSGFEKQGVDSARKRESGYRRNFSNGWLPWMMDNSGVAKQGHDSVRKQENQDADKKTFTNGWLPLIIDDSRLGKHGGDSTRKKEHRDEDKQGLPFPLFWVPYNFDDSKEKTDDGKINAVEEGTEEKPKFTALGSEDKDSTRLEVNEVKNIPARSAESTEAGKIPKKNDEKMESSSIEHANGGTEEVKSHQGSKKSRPSSPSKSQKLPPVCLRVDPVHKKKNCKGSLRSPSPPKEKEKHQQPIQSDSKQAVEPGWASGNSVQESCNDSKRERKVKTIEVTAGANRTDENVASVEKRTSKAVEGSSSADRAAAVDMYGKNVKVDEAPSDMAKNVRKLSEDEAATIIQSAYRGYEVRRWDLLKKLKQIADVRDQVVKLDKQISSDKQIDNKWRISVEETIMNLLLKLDTIQGLHPSIREIRKSVARELVSLQEKIDSLTSRKSEIVLEQNSGNKFDQGGQGQEKVSVESMGFIPKNAHEVHSEVSKDVASTGLDWNDRETGAPPEMLGAEPKGMTTPTITGCDSENEATTTIDSSEILKSQNEAVDHVFSSDHRRSDGSSLQLGHDDVVSGPSSGKPLEDSLRANAVSETENEAWNDSSMAELSQFGGDASAYEPVAASQGASDTDLPGTILSCENEGATIAMEFSPDHDSPHIVNGEMVSSVTDEVSDLKEVSESPEDRSTDNLLGDSLLDFVAGNDNSQHHETVMEDGQKGEDLTQEEAIEGFNDGGDNSNWAACGQRSDEVGVDANEKGTYDKVLHVHQQQETGVEVLPPTPTASDSFSGNDVSGLTEVDKNLVDKKLIEENEKLREAMQKLIEAGNEQLAAISNLSGRVKDLEKKLQKKNRLKMRGQHWGSSRYASRKPCMKQTSGGLNARSAPLSM